MSVSMRRPLLALLFLCCGATVCSAASYLYVGPPIPIPQGGGTSGTTISTINVPDNLLVSDVTVTVDITHTFI